MIVLLPPSDPRTYQICIYLHPHPTIGRDAIICKGEGPTTRTCVMQLAKGLRFFPSLLAYVESLACPENTTESHWKAPRHLICGIWKYCNNTVLLHSDTSETLAPKLAPHNNLGVPSSNSPQGPPNEPHLCYLALLHSITLEQPSFWLFVCTHLAKPKESFVRPVPPFTHPQALKCPSTPWPSGYL